MEKTRRRPQTGEKRRTQQPLKIDKLPVEVREAILWLHNNEGRSFDHIEAQSGERYSKDWRIDGGGFVEWEALPLPVLELFPEMRLPHTNLHRWHDLRFKQVQRDIELRSAQARELAAGFAKSLVKGGDEGVLNAARDQLMHLLAEDTSAAGRILATKGLIALAEKMQKSRSNDIKERQVGVNERRIKAIEKREALARERLDQATQSAAKKGKGQFGIEEINLLRERTFGLPPLAVAK